MKVLIIALPILISLISLFFAIKGYLYTRKHTTINKQPHFKVIKYACNKNVNGGRVVYISVVELTGNPYSISEFRTKIPNWMVYSGNVTSSSFTIKEMEKAYSHFIIDIHINENEKWCEELYIDYIDINNNKQTVKSVPINADARKYENAKVSSSFLPVGKFKY